MRVELVSLVRPSSSSSPLATMRTGRASLAMLDEIGSPASLAMAGPRFSGS